MEALVITWFLIVNHSGNSRSSPVVIEKFSTQEQCEDVKRKYIDLSKNTNGFPYGSGFCLPVNKSK